MSLIFTVYYILLVSIFLSFLQLKVKGLRSVSRKAVENSGLKKKKSKPCISDDGSTVLLGNGCDFTLTKGNLIIKRRQVFARSIQTKNVKVTGGLLMLNGDFELSNGNLYVHNITSLWEIGGSTKL